MYPNVDLRSGIGLAEVGIRVNRILVFLLTVEEPTKGYFRRIIHSATNNLALPMSNIVKITAFALTVKVYTSTKENAQEAAKSLVMC